MCTKMIQILRKFVALIICLSFGSTFVPVIAQGPLEKHALEDLRVVRDILHNVERHLMETDQQCHPHGRRREPFRPLDCEEVLRRGNKKSGVYTVYPRNRVSESRPLDVYCDMQTDGGGWTSIQRRGEFSRPMDYFFKNWDSYKNGFGDIERDFWLGNDAIFALTNQREYSVRFELSDFEGNCTYALYDRFFVEDENNGYKLHIQDYTGNAGDSMKEHNGQKFQTKSNYGNNDLELQNCADYFKGAWWYKACHEANLNGLYKKGHYDDGFADGVVWKSFRGYQYSLRTTDIKIRPRDFHERSTTISMNAKFENRTV